MMVLLRKVASVLLPTVVLSAAWVHKCQAEPPDPKVDADLVESLDASKERTLAELSKMATVSGEEYDRIKVKIQQGLEESLKPVGDAITKTKELVDERFGAWDALSQESRQTKLEAALKDGGLEPALSEMANQIRRTLEAVGQEFLDQRHQELKLILRSNLMQRFPTPIDDYLLEGLERDNRLNIEKEKELSTDLQGKKPVAVLGTAAVIIARRALQKIFQKIGGTFLKKLMGNAVVRSVLFPGEAGGLYGAIGEVVFLVGGAVVDAFSMGSSTREDVKASLDRFYESNCREELTANHRLFVDEMVASLKEALAVLERTTREMLQTTWDGIILHAQSEGMAEYAAGKDPRDVEYSLRDVAAAFGRLHTKGRFRDKLSIVRSLGLEKTRDLVGRFGPLVIETYGARPEMMNTLVNSAPMRLLEHVLTSSNPQAELEELEAYVRAVGKLEEEEGAALVLVRGIDPNLSLARVHREHLVRIAPFRKDLAHLAVRDAPSARKILAYALEGDLTIDNYQKLQRSRDSGAVLRVLATLGPTRFQDILKISGEEMLAAFLGDFPGEVGVKRLEEDGVSYLRFYALPDSGGPRAVQVWERLRKDYGSQISPETLTTVEWSLVHLISSGEGIDKAAIENLKSLRVSSLPRPVAVLVGNLLVKVGLGPTVLTLLALLTPILMLVLAIIFPDLGIRAARVIRGMVTDSPQAALVGEVSRSPLVVLGGKDTIRRLLDPPGSVDYVHPSSTTKSHEFEPAGDAGPAAGEEAESGTDGARECSRVDGDRAPSPDQPDTASTPTPADTAALPGRASGGTSEDR